MNPPRGYHVTEVFQRGSLWFWRCRTCNTFDGAYKGHREADKDAGKHEGVMAVREAS